MNVKPYHEHPLLRDYSDWRGQASAGGGSATVVQFRADWFCPTCGVEIVGPPYEVGEYVVTNAWKVRALSVFVRGKWYDRGGKIWRVYMRSQFDNPQRVPLFESTRKREALKHARYLDKERIKIEALVRGEFSTPDEKLRAVADNYKRVLQLQRAERDC